jgi:hypothetical protein
MASTYGSFLSKIGTTPDFSGAGSVGPILTVLRMCAAKAEHAGRTLRALADGLDQGFLDGPERC